MRPAVSRGHGKKLSDANEAHVFCISGIQMIHRINTVDIESMFLPARDVLRERCKEPGGSSSARAFAMVLPANQCTSTALKRSKGKAHCPSLSKLAGKSQ